MINSTAIGITKPAGKLGDLQDDRKKKPSSRNTHTHASSLPLVSRSGLSPGGRE